MYRRYSRSGALLWHLLPYLLLLVLLLTACGGEEPDLAPAPTPSPTAVPESVSFSLPRTGGSIHPILSRDRVNLSLSGLLWEGLFALDSTFTPQPVLCSSHTVSEDGLSWTFVIRPGVTFSDGSPLTAADVVFSLNLARSTESRYATRLAELRSVEELDGAVSVILTSPNGALPALLDIPVVRGESEQPVGTGPYVLTDEGESTALTARPDWWQEKPLPAQRIPLRTLPEADDLISAFDTGDISLVTADLTGTNAVGYSGSYETWDYPTTGLVYLGFNCAGNSPCADPALRRALAHSLDRNTVSGALYANHAKPSALPVSPASHLYDEALAEHIAYSPQLVSTLLSEAGYEKNADGLFARRKTVLTLDLVVNTDNSFRLSTAEYLAAELTRAGVTVNLRQLPWNDYLVALSSGDFDLYVGETVLKADFDLSSLLMPGGALNYGKYSGTEVSNLLPAFRAARDDARKTAFSSLCLVLEQEMPFAAICFKNQSVLTQWGIVSGLAPTQQDPFFQITGWDIHASA